MKILIRILLPLLGIISAASTAQAQSTGRPNVLLIITDDQNIDTVGCYGAPVETPAIDSLARNGVKFTNANVVHSICSPSRYAILTGRYYDNNRSSDFLQRFPPGEASTVNNFMELEEDGSTLPSVMRANGYHTGYIGKFHLTGHHLLRTNQFWEQNGLQTYPADADPRKDAAVNAKMKANHDWWRKQVMARGFDYADAIYSANLREGFNEFLNAHNVEWTADGIIRFLEASKEQEKPFFAVMATTFPHGPTPNKVRGKYRFSLDTDVQITGEGFVEDRDLSKVLANGVTRESVKDLEGAAGMSPDAPAAKWWDAAVGATIETLKKTGQFENTLIIYISDHGKAKGTKTTLYENGIHVPLLIQWPKHIARGQVYEHVVGSIDLAPTIMEACGITRPSEYVMDGLSLMPALTGSDAPLREALFLQMGYAHGIKTDNWKYIAVRYPAEIEQKLQRGEWKAGRQDGPDQPYLMAHPQLSERAAKANRLYFVRNQLFDLTNDPEEKKNLFARKPEMATKMKALLDSAMRKHLPHRPFGEFGLLGKPEVFAPVSNLVD